VKTGRPNCHFTRGPITGASERLRKQQLICEELKCRAKGDGFCEFSVKAKP